MAQIIRSSLWVLNVSRIPERKKELNGEAYEGCSGDGNALLFRALVWLFNTENETEPRPTKSLHARDSGTGVAGSEGVGSSY